MTVALIVAAGSGERLRAGRPKALVELAGRPLVQWSVQALLGVAEIERVLVALPAGAQLPQAIGGIERVQAVVGGASRSDSVRRALRAAGAPAGRGAFDFVLVHDAARPLLTPALAEAVIAALDGDPDAHAAIAATPVTDTVKRVDRAGAVRETLERGELWAVQTPQVFRRRALQRALDVPEAQLSRATDDAWLIVREWCMVIVFRSLYL
jgi:2-C-methyl-D-erythritol 4-phosphate cytidylyltransferase